MKLKLESGGLFEDLPRREDGTAIVADPRNDENLMIDNAVDLVRGQGISDPADVFAAARRLTTWYYQWLILREFLPQIAGQGMVDDGTSSRRPRSSPTVSTSAPSEAASPPRSSLDCSSPTPARTSRGNPRGGRLCRRRARSSERPTSSPSPASIPAAAANDASPSNGKTPQLRGFPVAGL